MKILVTGGAGFIGSHLVESLLGKGNEVVIYDTFGRDALKYAHLPKQPKKIVGDVLDGEKLADAAVDCDAIIHLAAIAGVSSVVSSPVKVMDVNYLGTRNALAAAKSVSRFIFFSTSEVYGQHAENVSETSPTIQGSVTESRWSYAVSKIAGEHLCHAFFREKGTPVVCVRPFNIYGERQVGEGGVQKMACKALQNEDVTVNGDGSQTRAWCHVSDLVAGVNACLENDNAVGKSFNIGNPAAAVSVKELAQKIISLSGSKSKIVFKKIDYPEVYTRVPVIDFAKKELGFTPKISLEDGLKRTISWFKESGACV